MPRIGAHFSIAGGYYRAAETALRFQCNTFQLFTKNASQWAAPVISDEHVRLFQDAVKLAGAEKLVAHDSYLINLAAPGEELFQKSIQAFIVELERAEKLGLAYLVMHPGAHVGSGDEAGLKRVVAGLDEALRACSGFRVQMLVETTAGQGTTLGHRFEHLAYLLNGVQEPERVGVCLDTCHVFAAGYPLGTEAEYTQTFAEFEEIVGLQHIKVFHVNDSVKPLGRRVDRHAGLGLGLIGKDAFRFLMTDSRFQDRSFILETPKEDDDGNEMDPVNLKKLRGYLRKAAK